MAYRDETLRVSLPMIRANYTPKDFRQRREVVLEAAGVSATVKIIREPSSTSFGGTRRWMACPKCGRRTHVVGLVTVNRLVDPTWCCSRRDCGAWRSRKTARLHSTESVL
jgi:hypothetical protein